MWLCVVYVCVWVIHILDVHGCVWCDLSIYIDTIHDLVPKGVHENRTKGVENKVDDTLKLVVFLECAQC